MNKQGANHITKTSRLARFPAALLLATALGLATGPAFAWIAATLVKKVVNAIESGHWYQVSATGSTPFTMTRSSS
jgi:ABC-type uncharacterized transport system permease subunit